MTFTIFMKATYNGKQALLPFFRTQLNCPQRTSQRRPATSGRLTICPSTQKQPSVTKLT